MGQRDPNTELSVRLSPRSRSRALPSAAATTRLLPNCLLLVPQSCALPKPDPTGSQF